MWVESLRQKDPHMQLFQLFFIPTATVAILSSTLSIDNASLQSDFNSVPNGNWSSEYAIDNAKLCDYILEVQRVTGKGLVLDDHLPSMKREFEMYRSLVNDYLGAAHEVHNLHDKRCARCFSYDNDAILNVSSPFSVELCDALLETKVKATKLALGLRVHLRRLESELKMYRLRSEVHSLHDKWCATF